MEIFVPGEMFREVRDDHELEFPVDCLVKKIRVLKNRDTHPRPGVPS